jgi:hypothetical protein
MQYKGYFIDGSALIVHPFSPDWYVGGSILVPRRSSPLVELGRFQLQRFTVSVKRDNSLIRCQPGSYEDQFRGAPYR